MGFVTLRVVCFSGKEMGTWRGASLFVRGHPPHSLPGVYRFSPTAYRPGVTEAVMGRNRARWDMAAMILRRASARLLIYLGRVTI